MSLQIRDFMIGAVHSYQLMKVVRPLPLYPYTPIPLPLPLYSYSYP